MEGGRGSCFLFIYYFLFLQGYTFFYKKPSYKKLGTNIYVTIDSFVLLLI